MAALRSGSSGRVVIGASGAAIVSLMPMGVLIVLKSMPNANVEVLEAPMDRLFHQLTHREIDIAVGRSSCLSEEIYAQLPNMFASSLALPSMAVDMAQVEVALHILFVTFQAMKLSGHRWPLVTEDIQDGCLQRLTARARFNDGLPKELPTKLVEQFHAEHAERYLLAFVYYSWLGEHDRMALRTEAEKYLMLGALNLVECVAFIGAIKPTR